MMLICNLKTLFLIYLSLLYIESIHCLQVKPRPKPRNDKDPFNALGIPDLNPKTLLLEIDQENNKNKPKSEALKLKTIDDLPNFLQKSNLSEDEGIKVLTRFLIQDDLTLKKFGVVYDQSGFDGLPKAEPLAPIGTDERLIQRARSAANIWFKSKYTKLEYDAYGAENIMDEIVPNWRIFKVLMIGKNGESTFVKICLPLDESETALGSDKDDACGPRTQFVEKEKAKNEAYITQIRSKKFFRKSSGIVKLLPGEKMVAKESSNNTVVLDSHNIEDKIYGNNNFYNPPSLDQKMNDPLIAAFQRKNNNLPMNLRNFGQSPYQGIPQNFPNSLNNNLNNLQAIPSQGSIYFNSANLNPNYQNFNPNYNNYNANQNFNPQQFKVPMDLLNNNNLNYQPQQQQSGNLNNFSLLSNNIRDLNSFKKPTEFKFKEKEALPETTNSFNRLENELSQMKKQLSDMMSSLKEKDQIIKDQTTKLSQFLNSSNNNQPQLNSLSNQQLNNSVQYQNSQGYQANIPQRISNNLYDQSNFQGGPNRLTNLGQSQSPYNNQRYLYNSFPNSFTTGFNS